MTFPIDFASIFTTCGSQALYGGGGGGSSSVIQSIQPFTVTVNSGSTTASTPLGLSVNTSNSMVLWNGQTTTNASTAQDSRVDCIVQLTGASTVTITRGNSSGDSVTVYGTIVEFVSSVVNSIQKGVITIGAGAGATGTQTLGTSVGSTAFVVYNGVYNTTTVGTPALEASVQLNTSTGVVTATVTSSGSAAQNVAFCVVDLTSAAVTAVQQVGNASTSSATTDNDTVTSVNTSQTTVMFGGYNTVGSSAFASWYRSALTSSTNVAKTRVGTGTQSRTVCYTLVSWASSALSTNAVQRTGSIALSSATSATGTVTNNVNNSSGGAAKAFVNYTGFSSSSGNPNVIMPGLTLDVGSAVNTVTAHVNTAGSPTIGVVEVVEFA